MHNHNFRFWPCRIHQWPSAPLCQCLDPLSSSAAWSNRNETCLDTGLQAPIWPNGSVVIYQRHYHHHYHRLPSPPTVSFSPPRHTSSHILITHSDTFHPCPIARSIRQECVFSFPVWLHSKSRPNRVSYESHLIIDTAGTSMGCSIIQELLNTTMMVRLITVSE